MRQLETSAYVNGRFIKTSGKLFKKISPIDGKALPSLQTCSFNDVHLAVQNSHQAFEDGLWRLKSAKQKKIILLNLADLIRKNLSFLAKVDSIETGRPYQNFTKDSIPKAIEAIEWFSEAIDKLQDTFIQENDKYFSQISREPLGPVAIILPWNDPLVVALWKIAPALLMGNSIVVKPAEQATYSILKLAKLANQAGVPSGVFNVLPGGEVTGNALVKHPLIRGIFFTGSSEVAKKIYIACGHSTLKKIGLECGGKSAFIVTKNCANLSLAAKTLAKNIFYNQGQICSAPSRLIIESCIESQFISLLKKELPKYLPGDPLKTNTKVGAVVDKNQYERIQKYITLGEKSGFTKIQAKGFKKPYSKGFYCPPTVFLNVPLKSKLTQEEIFGPVLITHCFKTMGEALLLANDTPFGLAAAIWTENINEAFDYSQNLKAGIVHINSYGGDSIRIPFGGIKNSGVGLDKSLFAFDQYSHLKATCLQRD
jgi:acyl-CoA reductase-like NAD-dependent aldehyde dehydrogenase